MVKQKIIWYGIIRVCLTTIFTEHITLAFNFISTLHFLN